MNRAHVLAALFVVAAGHACTANPMPPAKPPAPAVPPPRITVTSSAVPAPPPPLPGGLVPEAPVPPTVQAPLLGPVVTGEVRCGQRPCKVPEEVCCDGSDAEHEQRRECMPASAAKTCMNLPANRVGFIAECDTSDDCKKGERCCAEAAEGVLGEEARCTSQACGVAELCHDGSCPRGQHCSGSGDALGTCQKDGVAVQCGAALCNCNTPVCHWSPDTMTGTCVSEDDVADVPQFFLRCDDHADCPAGQACWVNNIVDTSFCCGKECFTDMDPSLFCTTVADCKKWLWEAWIGTCEAAPKYPNGLRWCARKE